MAEAAGPGERNETAGAGGKHTLTYSLPFIPVMDVHVRSLLTLLHMTLTLGIAVPMYE